MSTSGNPEFVCIDYHVVGRRSAVDVHLGRSHLVGISLADSHGRSCYFTGNFHNVIGSLGDRHRVYHDALFSRAVEHKYALPWSNTLDCTCTMGHLLDENTSHDFGKLIQLYSGDLARLSPVQVYGPAPGHQLIPLNSACLPWLLYVRHEQSHRIVAEQLEFIYQRIELPLVEPILAMSWTGIKLDLERLQCIHESHETQCEITRQQLEYISGRPFELGPPSDAVQLLFEHLRLPILATTQSGAPSTDREDLEPLWESHPAVDLVIQGRQLQHVANSAKSLLGHVDTSTGRVYPGLDPLGAVTGRLSCSSPNLQALPAAMLEAIVADDDEEHVLAEIDFSQMELRVLANLSQDSALCDAFIRDQDIHQTTAAKLFGLSPECVSPEQRQIGKQVNFGIVFGQMAGSLGRKLGVSVHQANEWIDGLDRAYPGVARFVTNIKSSAEDCGLVTTHFGRRRRLPDVHGRDGFAERQHALRQATNFVVQGTAADINKLALSRVFHSLPSSVRLLFNNHDSILLQLPRDAIATQLGRLQEIMEQTPPAWGVPLRTSAGVGQNWYECKHPAGADVGVI
jgi:DNA polymerase-1